MSNEQAIKLAMAVYNAALDMSIDENGDKRNFDSINITYSGEYSKTIRGALQGAREYLDDVISEIWS